MRFIVFLIRYNQAGNLIFMLAQAMFICYKYSDNFFYTNFSIYFIGRFLSLSWFDIFCKFLQILFHCL